MPNIVCPCCRYRRETPDKFLFDLASGTVRTEYGEAHLSPRQADIFAILASNPGRFRTRQIILDTVDRSPDPPFEGVIQVHIFKIRKAIRPIGLTIDTLYGFGYSLNPQITKPSLEPM